MKKQDGFTYLEIMISFVLFGLLLVIILRVGDSVNKLIRASEETNHMIHIAELELENYKSGISDIPGFVAITGFVVVSEIVDVDSNVVSRNLIHSHLEDKYTIEIKEYWISESLKNVQIIVNSNILDIDPVIIENKIITDSL